mgnify:CR=1 FL=1
MNEGICDYRKISEIMGVNVAEEDKRPVVSLLDLKKGFQSVSKPALRMLLERYGLRGRLLETVMDLHDTTEYKVKEWKSGMSESWIPASGLCDGRSISHILFHNYHQAVMSNRAGWKGIVSSLGTVVGGRVNVE